MLQALREGCGWSVPMLAVELEAQARAIGRPLTNRESLIRRIYDWEAGGHRPRDYYVLFILVYASDEELAARSIEPGSELDRLMAALKMMGVPVNRRKFLLNSAALAAGVTGVPAVAADLEGQQRLAWMLKHPRSVDLSTVAYLRQQAVGLLKQNEAMPSTSLLPVAVQQLEQVTLLREHAPAGAVRRGLAAIEVQSATLMGRLVWDVSGQRDHAAAARYYEQAIHAAAGAKQGWAEAFPRLFQAFLTTYGRKNAKTGLDLATRAATRAGNGSSHAIGGWAWALAGVADARLGHERPARVALDRASVHMAKVQPDDPIFGVFTTEELGGFRGACHLYLSDPKGAQVVLGQTAQSLGVGWEKNKAVVLGDLAKAFIYQGDPEQAAAVLHESIDLVEQTRSAAGLRRVFKAGWQLRPWRHELFVQDVQDRLLALGCAVPPQ
jgi:hypothetical protein